MAKRQGRSRQEEAEEQKCQQTKRPHLGEVLGPRLLPLGGSHADEGQHGCP